MNPSDPLEVMREESRRKIAALLERIASRPVSDVAGVVKSVAGFGSLGEPPSASISFAQWREPHHAIARGPLYVRFPACDEERLRRLRQEFPEHHVVRLRVRLNDEWRELSGPSSATLEALFVDVLPPGDEDPELEDCARNLRSEAASAPLGRPAFDPSWLFFEFLARFVAQPDLPVVQLGEPLPDGVWTPCSPSLDDKPLPAGHERFERASEHGRTTATVVQGRVGAVTYDFDTYRESGVRRMRKLQSLIAAHGQKDGTLHRILDNQHGAMFYRNQTGSCLARYAYNSDRLLVQASWCPD